MADFKELQEQRSNLAAQIKDLAASQDNWDSEDRAKWEEVNAAYDANQQELTAAKEKADVAARAAQIEAAKDEQSFQQKRERKAERRPEITEETRQLAFQAWARHQNGFSLEDKHVEAAQRCGIDPQAAGYEIRLSSNSPKMSHGGFGKEYRAQSVGTDSAGGYLVPEGFSNELEKSLLAFGGPRKVARVIRTSSGNDLPWPTVNDTGNTGRLLSENAAITETAVTFGSKTFSAYKFSSDSCLVSSELMQDSAFNLASEVGAMLGERLGRIEASYFTTGTGSSQPGGIVTGAGAGVTAASATAIAADELFELVHSVDPAYRGQSSCGWMMHDNVLLALRKLKDGNDQYLWQEGMSAGEPDRLLGHPITINQNMASSVATGEITVLFGAMAKFIIRDAGSVRLYKLEERYRDNDQTGFVAFKRSDSGVIDAGTDPIKKLTQA